MVVPTQAGDLDPVALETALMQTWSDENTFAQSIEAVSYTHLRAHET